MRLNRKHIVAITCVMGAAILLVTTLSMIALKPVNQKNGFKRTFVTPQAIQVTVIDKPKEVVDISGHTGNTLFFQTAAANRIWQTNRILKEGQFKSFNFQSTETINSAYFLFIDSPNVFMMAGRANRAITGSIDGPFSLYTLPFSKFTKATMVNQHSFIYRVFDTTGAQMNQVFIKDDLITKSITKENGISERANDAGIATDGKLFYDAKTNRLIYSYFYRNQILCFDTSLNLLNRYNTVDKPVEQNIVKAEKLPVNKSLDVYTNTTPKRSLNYTSDVTNGRLYICSGLQADNEDAETFSKNSVIDVYNVQSGEYLGSFYIPYYSRERIKHFKIVDDNIIVITRSYILSYKLPSITG